MSLETLAIVIQQGIAQSEQLHDTLILSDIFMTLDKVHVRATVAALERHATRSFLCLQDMQYRVKAHDPNDWLTTLVCTRNSKVKI